MLPLLIITDAFRINCHSLPLLLSLPLRDTQVRVGLTFIYKTAVILFLTWKRLF